MRAAAASRTARRVRLLREETGPAGGETVLTAGT
jgi:hypothetical protein